MGAEAAFSEHDLKMAAAFILRHRRKRASYFGELGKLLGEPAWDMLLDLYVHQGNKQISTTSACLASGAAPTTALRTVRALESIDWLRFSDDPNDMRRRFVSLSERAVCGVEGWLRSYLAEAAGERGEEVVLSPDGFPSRKQSAEQSSRGALSNFYVVSVLHVVR